MVRLMHPCDFLFWWDGHHMCQRVGMPGLGSRLSTYLQNGPTNGGVVRHLCQSNSYPLRPRRVTLIKWRVCEKRMLRRSQTGQAWLELRSQDWGPRHATYLRIIQLTVITLWMKHRTFYTVMLGHIWLFTLSVSSRFNAYPSTILSPLELPFIDFFVISV